MNCPFSTTKAQCEIKLHLKDSQFILCSSIPRVSQPCKGDLISKTALRKKKTEMARPYIKNNSAGCIILLMPRETSVKEQMCLYKEFPPRHMHQEIKVLYEQICECASELCVMLPNLCME